MKTLVLNYLKHISARVKFKAAVINRRSLCGSLSSQRFLLWWKMAMMFVLAAVLLTYGVSTGIAMEAGESGAVARARAGGNSVLPLDMAEDSVDDMYNNCDQEMKKKVVTEYLKNEKNNNSKFKAVWESQESLEKKNRDQQKKYQIVAIRTYTDKSGVYLDFNNKVRTQGPQYKTAFGYHALHFFLTTAIQALRANKEKQTNEKYCLTGYRRVDSSFSRDVLNKEFRFGSFTSASLGDYGNKERFGDKSCFEIVTCMGADISIYSKFENEAEVLIPPYEVFKVVEINDRSKQPKLPCEVEYRVKSTGTPVSKLNCTLITK